MMNLQKEFISAMTLPEKKISLDGTNYFIHGLVHGSPLVNINLSFKKEIGRQLKGKDVLCEDGFTSWIPRSVSMNEAEYFNMNKLSLFDIAHFWWQVSYAHLSPHTKKLEPEFVSEVRKMNSIEDLTKIREKLFEGYLPEPEGMNLLMQKNDSGTIDSPKGDVPLRVRRYIYEAKISLDYAQRNNLDELHVVVGCAHERPLEYLLTHKDILNKYSL